MKRILGLDIGVSSVGMAIINESNNEKIIKNLSVRIIPEDPDFHGKFYSGNTASKNLGRTEKRGIRRGNQRFKLRRDKLYRLLKVHGMFPDESLMRLPAIELYSLRARAVEERISLKEIGRVLILLNQRRGFLSNRKSISEDESSSEYKERIAKLEKELNGKTIGQQLYNELKNSVKIIDVLIRERTYQRASYINEFDRIWDKQRDFHPDLLTGGSQLDSNKGTLYDEIRNRIIYYQRPLKSQKGLVSECEFEQHHKAISKSSPYFELFRIWQKINNLSWNTINGEKHYPNQEQKTVLFDALFYGQLKNGTELLNGKYKLTVGKIKNILGYKTRDKIYLNFTELDGSRTYSILKKALLKAGIEDFKKYLFFDYKKSDEKRGLFELWHITYSIPDEKDVVNTLKNRFGFTSYQSKIVADNVKYGSEYGKLSTRAIKKLLPYLEEGVGYSEACDKVGYDHSGYKTKIELKSNLKPVVKNSLRNPVVEQILNQVVNMVNIAIEEYGTFDEIRVELARELRNSAATRKRISMLNSKNRKLNDKIRTTLRDEYGFKIVNGRDIKRFKLWEETGKVCLYCNNPIQMSDILSGQADIEHILPKSRSFSNSMSNFILAHRKCNADKNQMTAFDFMSNKSEDVFNQYVEKVNALYKDGKGTISKSKFDNLLTKGENIPSDFVDRMLKDSQYIAKEAVKMLKIICENVYTTTGQITDLLRKEWELKDALQEVMIDKYREAGLTEYREYKDSKGDLKKYEAITDWSKRDDHRHHAIDALICALTDQKIIFKLNNLNKLFQYAKSTLSEEEIRDMEKVNKSRYDLKEFVAQGAYEFPVPIPNLREEVISHLESILISFKKENSKVLTKTINRTANKNEQTTWTPRGKLHEETIMGKVKRVSKQKLKLQKIKSLSDIELVISPNVKELLIKRIEKFGFNIDSAFSQKGLKKDKVFYKGKELKETATYEFVNTKRVELTENFTEAQLGKIADKEVEMTIRDFIANNGGSIKTAFKNIKNNPVKLKNGTIIKAVTVYDESKVEQIRTGFAKTGGNHHALVYVNEYGVFKDKVVSFYEAVAIGLQNIRESGKPYPIINRNDDPELGVFQFSMQINDLFVFDLKHSKHPQDENELDFFDMNNRKTISKKLFRLQKMSKKGNGQFDVHFRHHLETTVNRNIKELTWINISSNKYLGRLTKIRLNHIGQIIRVGE